MVELSSTISFLMTLSLDIHACRLTHVRLLFLPCAPFHLRNIMLHCTRQSEILINAYLLNIHFKKALGIAGVWGLVLYLNTLVQPTMNGVFFTISILGGANDLLVVRVRVNHVLSSVDRIFSLLHRLSSLHTGINGCLLPELSSML
jgi:hypothetical protein